MIDEKFIEQIATKVMKQLATNQEFPQTPVGVSNRHIHLSQSHMEALFGHGYKLTKLKDLKQPGQFAAKETVMIIGPKGIINNVRILGPLRQETQVEVSITDCYKLGVNAPIRESGQIEGTPGIVIKGPKGVVELEKGVIVAKRHIHMAPETAKKFNLQDKEIVKVKFPGERSIIFDEVLIRVSDQFVNEMHIDTDEANAGKIKNGAIGIIIKD